MKISLIIYTVLMFITLSLMFFTGIVIILKALKKKFVNLYLLGVAFFLLPVMMIIVLFTHSWLLYDFLHLIVHVLILIFVKKTFNLEKELIFKFLLTIILFLGISFIILVFSFDTINLIEKTPFVRFLVTFFASTQSLIVFIWYGKNAYKSYNNLKELKIEAWIPMRIKIIAISSFIFSFFCTPEYIRLNPAIEVADYSNPISLLSIYLVLIICFIFTISQYFAWVMPKRFKNYLINKNSSISENESNNESTISEEKLFELLKGNDISEK